MGYPVTLNGRTYTLADFEGNNYVDGLPDAFEDFVTHAGDIYNDTSTTSNSIGTGSKTFTVASGKPYQAGTPLRIADAAAPATNFLDAVVTSYSGTTLVVEAIGYGGSGTKTSWTVNIGGAKTIDGTLGVSQGGTGATTAAAARTNLETYSKTEADSRFLNVSGEASDVTMTGNVTIGDAGTDTLTINAATTTTANISFGDDDKAIFGAGSDLQIYHNANNSYVQDVGTGKLHITSDGTGVSIDKGTSELMATFDIDGAVTLYYDNAVKLATTSTGVDITGTLEADDYYVVSGGHIEFDFNGVAGPFTSTNSAYIFTGTGGAGSYLAGSLNLQTRQTENRNIQFITGTTPTIRAAVGGTGDITFYDTSGNASFVYDESAGSTFNEQADAKDFRVKSDANSAMLFVDGTNNRVGMGTANPQQVLHIAAATPQIYLETTDSRGEAWSMRSTNGADNNTGTLSFRDEAGLGWMDFGQNQGSPITTFYNGGSNIRLQINTGEVVVNEGSIDSDFRVESDNQTYALFLKGSDGHLGLYTGNPQRQFVVSANGANGIEIDPNIAGISEIISYDRSTSQYTDLNIAASSIELSASGAVIVNQSGNDSDFRVESDSEANMLFVNAGTNRVGINTADTTLLGDLVVRGDGTYSSANGVNALFYANSGSRGTIRIRSVGDDSAECAFDVNGALRWMISARPSNDAQGAHCMKWYPASGTPGYTIVGGNVMTLTQSGDLTINGALSKGSGSFRIKHPLPEKNATHDLVHSFVEAPQADNIYRGKVALVAGQASVNIDTVAGMTEGTFAALNREVQCFTSNETGWTAVRGSVSGNILAIEAQDNTCTDTISWMVIGERQDEHMYDTNWTDENGKVIVEPLRPAGSNDPS